MAEMKLISLRESADIAIRKCATGFHVVGGSFGGEGERAFSTAEGLIEWLSRELGAGPIVWGLTLGVWMERAGITEEDLLPVPDQSVDPRGHQMAIEGNAIFLLNHFVEEEFRLRHPELPPEPKPKKEKRVKRESLKVALRVPGAEGAVTIIPKEGKLIEEKKEE